VCDGVVYFGSLDSTLYALDGATGEELWSYRADAGIPTSPAVSEGMVVFVTSDSHIYALGQDTGGRIWDLDLEGTVWSHPVIARNTVYFGGGDGLLHALDLYTGEALFEFQPDEAAGNLAVADGAVYLGAGKLLYCLN